MTRLSSIGDIARANNVPPARIAYVVAKHNIQPDMRCGIIRLFSTAQSRKIVRLAQTVRTAAR